MPKTGPKNSRFAKAGKRKIDGTPVKRAPQAKQQPYRSAGKPRTPFKEVRISVHTGLRGNVTLPLSPSPGQADPAPGARGKNKGAKPSGVLQSGE